MARKHPRRSGFPVCPYCDRVAELVDGSAIYPRRRDLHARKFWRCAPCDAWVGTHANSSKHAPLGRLANAELRQAKQAAHRAFDRLWKAKIRRDGCQKFEARQAAYAWLAERLGIDPKDAHIGMFDVDQCRRVVEVCKPFHGENRKGEAA